MISNEEQENNLWAGAFMAAYAIVLFKHSTEPPEVIGKNAEKHADWVLATLKDREAKIKKEKRR